MKKTTLLLTGIFACFNLFSQRNSERLKTHTVTTITAEDLGKIKLITPLELLSKDVFSASVKIEPGGKKEKDIARNTEILNKSMFDLGGNSFPVSQINSGPMTLTADLLKNLPIKLTGPDGKVLYQSILPDLFTNPLGQSPTFKIPTHVLTGSPFIIIGPFDGNSDNTKCTIGGKPAQIIAESPRQCIIEFPAEPKGPTTITIEENGVSVTENIGGVDMTVNAGKMNLKRGESTYIDVLISGLQNLSDNAVLSVTNVSTGVVTMVGGNAQVVTIPPSGITGAGTFDQRYNIQSIQTGDFSVNINLDLPQPPISSAPLGMNSWVSCEPCGGVMMPKYTCEAMTQLIQQYPSTKLTQTYDTTCSCFTFKPVISKDYIDFQFDPFTNNDLAMVVYTNTTPGSVNKVVASDNFDKPKTSIPPTVFSNGINNVTATVYHGNNYTTARSHNVVIIPNFNTTISNSVIEALRRRIQQAKDSIDNLQRIIDNGNRSVYDNYPTKRRLDSILLSKQRVYNQLVHIDAMLESIPKVYADTLAKLMDSLKRFKNKVPDTPDEDALKKKVADLEAALKACQDNLAKLQQEQKNLQTELQDVEQQQQDQLKKILDCFADAGYDYVGHTTRKNGEFGYGFDAVKNGKALGGIPAQCLKTVSEAKKKIEELKQRHRDIRDRLRDLPGELEQSKADCDRLSKELQQAKESLRKGKNAILEYGFINADMDDICRQIRGMLDELTRFCKWNPSVCNAEAQVEALMANCPPANLANFWDGFNNLVNYKKGIEDNAKKQADDAKRQADQTRLDENKIYEEMNRAKQQQDQTAGHLPGLLQQEEAATQAELEKKMAKQDSAMAMRRKICEEYLKTQSKTPEEDSSLATLLKIKEGIQGFGEKVKEAGEYGDKLTKEKYKKITDSLQKLIEHLVKPLEDYDKLKEEYDKWMKIKEDIQTVFSGDDSPKANAEKLKVILNRIKEQLDDLKEEFPILELFINYFGWLVDGYTWAVDQSFKNTENYFRINLEMKLRDRVSCDWVMNEYLKRKNVDDVVRRAKERINWDGEIDPLLGAQGSRDAAEGEMKKLISKMLADCCISYLMQ